MLLNYSNKNPTKCNDGVKSVLEKHNKIKSDTTISIVLPVAIIRIDDGNVTTNIEKNMGANQMSTAAYNAMSNNE